ncbi:unnamed protein product [Chondrus crispus]|uniref:Glutaminyl-tRNA synthetase class Ib non-specific RNA-binding domain-containing protein n=1 Tax=Chondrus crispus TaxID=2769 RepID=R7Q4E0_CHOCR|nr:unnamed protein product [Chondrus crispus]CDF32879.1 unnamed protein product [Chondrus crispus]|eukprot:XP_005712680.1 unnamed protein product [Chondrus crispus]
MPAGSEKKDAAASRIAELESFGLDSRLSSRVAESEKTFKAMISAFHEAGITPETNNKEAKAGLLYTAITKLGNTVGAKGRHMLFASISDGRVGAAPHVEAAAAWLVSFYRKLGDGVPNAVVKIDEERVTIDQSEFEEAAGVGVVVTEEEITAAVDSAIQENTPALVEKRYRFNTGLMQRDIMKNLRFAEGKAVSALITEKVAALLGPKTEADLAKP